MIEVVFGESEGGAIKVAKNYRKPDYNSVATAWIGKKASHEEFDKMYDGEAIGGSSSDVICIPFMLDIGDISIPINSEYRKNLILDIYTRNGMNDINNLQCFDEVWERYLKEIERLKNYASKGEALRLWYSNAPYSACGFYYVFNILSDYNCKVSVIKLPQYLQLTDTSLQFYVSWGEIDASYFYKFLSFEKKLSFCERRSLALIWSELKEEKSTLRAVVNGKVIGVPEDFYDYIIRKEFPEGEFIMAHLIGSILGKHPLGISDWWYAKRINKMIEEGELEVVQKQKDIYRQVLKKV